MSKICKHGKWFKNKWVSFYNQINDYWEKCCVCGVINYNPLPEFPEDFKEELGEELGDEGEQVEQLNNDIDICYALERLSPRQKQVAEFILAGYTEKEIAKELGINQSNVSRLLKRGQHILNLPTI